MMFYEAVKGSQARLTKYRGVMSGQVGLRQSSYGWSSDDDHGKLTKPS
ncbi:MAG: hypothetical protein F6K31_27070 [Symploca sp. SIO2G7]|nr:hypothetical protein [Symploca sp. SIO2G7]